MTCTSCRVYLQIGVSFLIDAVPYLYLFLLPLYFPGQYSCDVEYRGVPLQNIRINLDLI